MIQTLYIICRNDMYRGLEELSPCGVKIITNAVESGANPFGCTDYLNQKEKIYRTGVHVYEYLGEQAENVKCPNPKCGRRILDIEKMPSGQTVPDFPAIHLKTVKRAIHTFWRAYCGS